MKVTRTATLVAALVLGGASMAHAGPKYLVSAPAIRTTPAQTLYCDIVNLDSSPQDIIIDVMDYNGNVTVGPLPIQLPPNYGYYLPDTSLSGAWCRFTVNTSTKKFRAIAVYDQGTAYTVTIPAY